MSSALARKLQLYVRLCDADRVWLADALQTVRYVPAHADLAQEGDDPRVTYVILDGWAARCRYLSDGRRQITSLVLPGDCCDPHVSLFARRDHTITALTPIAVASIPGPTFQELVRRSSALERGFFFETMVAAAVQREVAVSLGRRSGIERLAHLLCEVHARLGAVGLGEETSCPMPMNQGDLADALGQTPVHVNRMLQELRGSGLITLRRRQLTIHDPSRLVDLAHFDPAYLHLPDAAQQVECP